MPELFIHEEDMCYIRHAVSKASFREVGGLGVIVVEDGKPTVKHMRLLEQTVSSGEVDWSDDAHPDYLEWLYTPEENGGAGFTETSYGIYSWHSHGNMSVFWSSTDQDFINKVGLTVPYVFSSVFNTKGDVKHRVDMFNIATVVPVIGHVVTYEKAELTILESKMDAPALAKVREIEAQRDAAMAEIEEQAQALIKDLDDEVSKELNAVSDTAKARMEEDWDKNVSFTQYGRTGPGATRTQITTGTAGRSSNGSSSNGGGAAGGESAGAGTGSVGGPTDDKVFLEVAGSTVDPKKETNFRQTVWLWTFDMELMVTSRVPLKEYLSDPNLVPLQEISEDLICCLKADEIATIVSREDVDEGRQLRQMCIAYGYGVERVD